MIDSYEEENQERPEFLYYVVSVRMKVKINYPEDLDGKPMLGKIVSIEPLIAANEGMRNDLMDNAGTDKETMNEKGFKILIEGFINGLGESILLAFNNGYLIESEEKNRELIYYIQESLKNISSIIKNKNKILSDWIDSIK